MKECHIKGKSQSALLATDIKLNRIQTRISGNLIKIGYFSYHVVKPIGIRKCA